MFKNVIIVKIVERKVFLFYYYFGFIGFFVSFFKYVVYFCDFFFSEFDVILWVLDDEV